MAYAVMGGLVVATLLTRVFLPALYITWCQIPPPHNVLERAVEIAELPATCIKYVRRVEELVGCPVALLSTSPQREDTILMTDPFRD